MKRKLVLILLLGFFGKAFPCTNLIVTKGASADGSAYLVYTNDGEWLYHFQIYQPKDYPKGATVDFTNRAGVKGTIPQVTHTYKLIGFHMNEFQLSVGETTFGGRDELMNQKTGFLEYWHLMRLALERAKTAREAIEVMTSLVEKYGYASEGESFSIADPNEAWLLEMVGKGDEKGAVWVARKIPDGMVLAHANHSRIGEFPLNDTKNCFYAKDVIKFAVKKGYYDPKSGKPFCFNEAYNPMKKYRMKYTECRVWSLYSRISPSLNLSQDYCIGKDGAEPYPLWIKPDKKLRLVDVMNLVRDHYEGTDFDMTKGLAAGPFGSPNRVPSVAWQYDSVAYSWERPISVYYTAFSFVAQMRNFYPNEVGGVVWFGEDDTYLNCYMPVFSGANDVAEPYKTGDIKHFSWQSAWWVFNFVSNYANLRFRDMEKDIQTVRDSLEQFYIIQADTVARTALELKKKSSEEMHKYLTDYTVKTGNGLVAEWIELAESLITKYNDGFVKDKNGSSKSIGYPDEWKKQIIENDKARYLNRE
ncbi:MAG: C69 family dipeptidase [Bacteroidales bacterium]|nr:C69 family dipeptidase [Bacteroidales bacterium]